jgi:hypothetical protein
MKRPGRRPGVPFHAAFAPERVRRRRVLTCDERRERARAKQKLYYALYAARAAASFPLETQAWQTAFAAWIKAPAPHLLEESFQ